VSCSQQLALNGKCPAARLHASSIGASGPAFCDAGEFVTAEWLLSLHGLREVREARGLISYGASLLDLLPCGRLEFIAVLGRVAIELVLNHKMTKGSGFSPSRPSR
jgi:hypothetical protein